MNKKNLGQFYTTNYKYILDKLYIPVNVKNIIEPFSGKGDLIKFINKSLIRIQMNQYKEIHY